MKLFASKDKKYEIVKVTDRAGNVYEIPVGPDGYVPQEAMKARFNSRYPDIFSKGMLRDLSRTSKKIYPAKMTPEEALQWWKATNKSDVEGIDAPSGSANYIPPVRRKAEKTQAKSKKAATKKDIVPVRRAPYTPRAIGPTEGLQNYEISLNMALNEYMGDDYGAKDRVEEYKHYLVLNSDAVKKAKEERRNRSKEQDVAVRSRVEARRAIPTQAPAPEATDVKLKTINEDLANRAQYMNSYRDYKEGSATEEYHDAVKEVNELALEHKREIDPMYWPEVDRLVQTFSSKYADWVNRSNSVDTMVPSVLVAGGFKPAQMRRKEKQNMARDKLSKEYNEIMAIKSRIKSVGRGGISTDDSNAVAKIEDKLVKLQDAHESKVRINKAVRAGENSKAFSDLNDKEKAEAKMRIARGTPIPGWELSNENAEIRRLKGRLTDIEMEQTKRQSGVQTGYPTMDGLEVVENADENRIQLIFDDKPSDEARSILKHNGFRWSPKNSAWQRELNDNGRRAAKRAIEELISIGGWE